MTHPSDEGLGGTAAGPTAVEYADEPERQSPPVAERDDTGDSGVVARSDRTTADQGEDRT
jgi:hypothetical protein